MRLRNFNLLYFFSLYPFLCVISYTYNRYTYYRAYTEGDRRGDPVAAIVAATATVATIAPYTLQLIVAATIAPCIRLQ